MSILRQSDQVTKLLLGESLQLVTEDLVSYINRGQGMVRQVSARIGEIDLVICFDQDYGEFRLTEDGNVIAQLQVTLTINPDDFISKPETASSPEAQTNTQI